MTVLEMIAIRLRIERKRKVWSQIYIAERLELGRNTTYSSWERGKKMPNAETILKLADLFDVSVDYLLGRTDKRYIDSKENEIDSRRMKSLSENVISNTDRFIVDGEVINEEQVKRLIAYIRAERSIENS